MTGLIYDKVKRKGFLEMKTRIISGCLMLPLAILVYLGGYWLMAAAFLVGIIGLHEFYKGFEAAGAKPNYFGGYMSVAVLYFFAAAFPGEYEYVMLWMAAVVMGSMIYGFRVDKRKLEDMTSSLMGIMYTGFLSVHIVFIDQSDLRLLIWLVFLAAFGTDIMAYFTGMAIGKHKLCPHLSPKKSIEGAVGGVIGSMLLCALFGWFVEPEYLTLCVATGFFGSIVAQFGDLSASAFKRQMGIKDYGNLIPGHGGILDRFDSVLFTAPVVFYCIEIFA